MKKRFLTGTLLTIVMLGLTVLVLVNRGEQQPVYQVEAAKAESQELDNSAGTILYGLLETGIHLVIVLDIPTSEAVQVSLVSTSNGPGISFSENDTALKTGLFRDETIIELNNGRAWMWSHFPIRFLENEESGYVIVITDADSGKVLSSTELVLDNINHN